MSQVIKFLIKAFHAIFFFFLNIRSYREEAYLLSFSNQKYRHPHYQSRVPDIKRSAIISRGHNVFRNNPVNMCRLVLLCVVLGLVAVNGK